MKENKTGKQLPHDKLDINPPVFPSRQNQQYFRFPTQAENSCHLEPSFHLESSHQPANFPFLGNFSSGLNDSKAIGVDPALDLVRAMFKMNALEGRAELPFRSTGDHAPTTSHQVLSSFYPSSMTASTPESFQQSIHALLLKSSSLKTSLQSLALVEQGSLPQAEIASSEARIAAGAAMLISQVTILICQVMASSVFPPQQLAEFQSLVERVMALPVECTPAAAPHTAAEGKPAELRTGSREFNFGSEEARADAEPVSFPRISPDADGSQDRVHGEPQSSVPLAGTPNKGDSDSVPGSDDGRSHSVPRFDLNESHTEDSVPGDPVEQMEVEKLPGESKEECSGNGEAFELVELQEEEIMAEDCHVGDSKCLGTSPETLSEAQTQSQTALPSRRHSCPDHPQIVPLGTVQGAEDHAKCSHSSQSDQSGDLEAQPRQCGKDTWQRGEGLQSYQSSSMAASVKEETATDEQQG